MESKDENDHRKLLQHLIETQQMNTDAQIELFDSQAAQQPELGFNQHLAQYANQPFAQLQGSFDLAGSVVPADLSENRQLRGLSTNQQMIGLGPIENYAIAQETLLRRLRQQQLERASMQQIQTGRPFPVDPLGLGSSQISATGHLLALQNGTTPAYNNCAAYSTIDSESGNQGQARTFPLRLHKILSNPEYQDCIVWLPHGRAWRIVNKTQFEKKVIPHHFRHARYASFMRQVNGWGFNRVTEGPDHNSYFHKFFLRGQPDLCQKMRRSTNSTKRQK